MSLLGSAIPDIVKRQLLKHAPPSPRACPLANLQTPFTASTETPEATLVWFLACLCSGLNAILRRTFLLQTQ
jgi:hypothetical protein